MIVLRNFVDFCRTSTRISHRYTRVPSLPNLPPSPASPSHPSACHRAPVWVPWVTRQSPTGCRFYIWYCKFLCDSLQYLPLSFLSSHRVHRSVLYVCFSTAALEINSSVPSLQIPYICVSIRYLSLLDLFHSAKWALVSSTSLEQIQMCSFLWLSSTPLCICTTAALSIHLLVNT